MFTGVICGPTGAGKSEIACQIALANGFEIISADSRQVYKGFHTGTGTVSPDWLEKVPHHFLGYLEPTSNFSVHQFCSDVMEFARGNSGKSFLVVGGTPLYIKSLLRFDGRSRQSVPESIRAEVRDIFRDKTQLDIHKQLSKWDPAAAKNIHPRDKFRLTKAMENYLYTGKSYREFDFPVTLNKEFSGAPLICLNPDREELYRNIDARVVQMFSQGWVSEVREILRGRDPHNLPSLNALGYQEIADFIMGQHPDMAEEDLIPEIQKKTRNYAKKQVNFFKGQLPELIQIETSILREKLDACNFNWRNFQINLENSLTEEKH